MLPLYRVVAAMSDGRHHVLHAGHDRSRAAAEWLWLAAVAGVGDGAYTAVWMETVND